MLASHGAPEAVASAEQPPPGPPNEHSSGLAAWDAIGDGGGRQMLHHATTCRADRLPSARLSGQVLAESVIALPSQHKPVHLEQGYNACSCMFIRQVALVRAAGVSRRLLLSMSPCSARRRVRQQRGHGRQVVQQRVQQRCAQAAARQSGLLQ